MGTHDVSLLSLSGGVFEVKATGGNNHLGGEDLDNRLVSYCAEEFKKKNKKDLSKNLKALRRLRTACERAKRTLSAATTAIVEIDSLCDGIDFNLTISRARFDELCADLFRATLDPVEKVLSDAKMSKGQVDEIILVGGSTRIPKIQELLSSYFNGKQLNKSINPDEAVAYGAAVQAAMLSGVKDKKFDEMVVIDVASLTLGLKTAGDVMTPIVPRGTAVPAKRSQVFSTYEDNQSGVNIQVYEGERQFTRDCILLGQFQLSGIPPAPRGVPQIEVSFDIDANGILNVEAVDKGTNKKEKITIKNEKGRLSKEDIERMVNDAKKYESEDKKAREIIDARNGLENYIYGMKNTMTDEFTKKLGEDDTEVIKKTIEEAKSWLESHKSEDRKAYDDKKAEIEAIVQPKVMKAYSAGQPTQETAEPKDAHSNPKVEEVD